VRTRDEAGLALALVSAATFGTSGTFAAALLGAGWTPGAAVTARVVVAALVLTVPALLRLRGSGRELRRGGSGVVVYGLVAVAGCQLCYFNAVEHLSVGVALLLEYSGALLVVMWLWLRHGHRPRRLTVGGSVVAAFGLVLVLDLGGDQRLDVVGVLWGLGSSSCCPPARTSRCRRSWWPGAVWPWAVQRCWRPARAGCSPSGHRAPRWCSRVPG